ncbi:MAG: type I-PGING CRISPR-associated protein Cas8c/Csp2 [Porphyromonas sp.]|nr:type I-PGING CRISPR-associated protein Cas8c/Csp2 [Porphyromonas sp.]
MKINEHPLVKYAEALILFRKEDSSDAKTYEQNLLEEIKRSKEHFRIMPSEAWEGKEEVLYKYVAKEKGDTAKGVFLSPSVISTDMLAGNVWKSLNAYEEALGESGCDLEKIKEVVMSEIPLTGEFLGFTEKGGITRSKPKASIREKILGTIATTTALKPCCQHEGNNFCIIPDLSIERMFDFIYVFDRMMRQETDKLMLGKVFQNKPKRSLLYRGNYPGAPRSFIMNGISLLAALGDMTKDSECSTRSERVLDALKSADIYLIQYGDAKPFSYSHHIIELAKQKQLRGIVDGMYYAKLYKCGKRVAQRSVSIEYERFDFALSRFLHLFNSSSFRDFMIFRAEYPVSTELLFNTYFIRIEKMDQKVVESAKSLGQWLNKIASRVAFKELEKAKGSPNYWQKWEEIKFKTLIELESSIFSAKSGSAMVAQILTRAGRISNTDAPFEASLFIENTITGNVPLDSAKDVLIAFSRIKSEKQVMEPEDFNNIEDNSEDLNNE